MKRSFIIAILLFGLFPIVALAQDGGRLPATASEGLQLLAGLLAAIALGLAGSAITNLINALPGLTQKQTTDAIKGLKETFSVLIPAASGLVAVYLQPVANLLDESGIWQIIVVAAPVVFARVYYEYKRRQLAAPSG